MNQRIRLKIGENEIELEGNEIFIDEHLKSFVDKCFSLKPSETTKVNVVTHPTKTTGIQNKDSKVLSPAEFVRQKSPKGGTEQLVVIAKYLEDYESLSEFSVKDITRVARVAKIGKIDNAYYPLAVKQGLLNRIKHGRYQITLTGEDIVLAMSNATE